MLNWRQRSPNIILAITSHIYLERWCHRSGYTIQLNCIKHQPNPIKYIWNLHAVIEDPIVRQHFRLSAFYFIWGLIAVGGRTRCPQEPISDFAVEALAHVASFVLQPLMHLFELKQRAHFYDALFRFYYSFALAVSRSSLNIILQTN